MPETIFVSIKVAYPEDGVGPVAVQTEAAFRTKVAAENYFISKASQAKEIIEDKIYKCTRALHEVSLT